MSAFREYANYDGLGLAELVRRKEVTPAELLEAALARIAAVNPKIQCVPLLMEEAARKQIAAGVAYGPFQGVPFLLKDLYLQLKGSPLTNGSGLFRDLVCAVDFTLTERYRAAGFVFAGRTTSPEFGLNMASEPVIFPPARNPWNPAHSPGGSSGGAAAAVAAGMVPVAHATDGGGSIRIPASNCGGVGLKPSRGRVSIGPVVDEGGLGFSCNHIQAKTVRDSATMLDWVSKPQIGDPFVIPRPTQSYASFVNAPSPRLKIGIVLTEIFGVPVDPEVAQAVKDTAKFSKAWGIMSILPRSTSAASRRCTRSTISSSSASMGDWTATPHARARRLDPIRSSR